MEGLVFIVLLAFGVWYFWGRRQLQVSRATNALMNIPGYSASFAVAGTEGTAVSVDTNTKKIAFVDRNGIASLYDFKEILAVEACRNGISFTKTNRGSQIVGAAIGHLLFSDKGFIVGGSTGSSRTSERVSALSIKIYVADMAKPVREIGIYEGSPIEIGSGKFRKYASILEEWYGRLRVAAANP
jgi:hypothetical protein